MWHDVWEMLCNIWDWLYATFWGENVTDHISFLSFIGVSIGGFFTLFQWKKNAALKRADYIKELTEKIRTDKDISRVIYMLEYGVRWYSPQFHSGSILERKVDRTLTYFSYILYLKNEKIKIAITSLLLVLSDINNKICNSNDLYKEQSEKLLNLDSIIDYISTHYYEDITLAELAKMTTMSKQHFIRSFTKKYQITPIKYLNMFRVVTAQRLLESNTMKVNDVSKSCGFNSNAHFSRTFKEIIGVAPKEYQLNFKNKKK